jgi:hypothetical protein
VRGYNRLKFALSRKTRSWGFGLLAAAAISMLVFAGSAEGYRQDLMVNLGTSLLIVALTYAIFDPVFQELRRSRVSEQPFFDEVRFSRNVTATTTAVRIMDTGNHILEGRQRDRFLEALRVAASRGTQIEILLLDPGAKATDQRAEEIPAVDVRAVIVENLRYLHVCRSSMIEDHAENIKVKMYDALPAIQLYQWGSRALISFYPIGQRASESPHLEVDVESSIGQFAAGRFQELWNHESTTLLDQWWTTQVSFCRDGEHVAQREVRYAEMSDRIYIDGNQIADLLIDFGRDHVTAKGTAGVRPFEQDGDYWMFRLSENSELYGRVIREFDRKYGVTTGRGAADLVILCLEPVVEDTLEESCFDV